MTKQTFKCAWPDDLSSYAKIREVTLDAEVHSFDATFDQPGLRMHLNIVAEYKSGCVRREGIRLSVADAKRLRDRLTVFLETAE